MNLASRMESNSERDRITLSVSARRALFDQTPAVKVPVLTLRPASTLHQPPL